ncbi:MAG: sporulation protein YabP [Eubacteriales bacterium]|nr:sporulation protein YabP [Eubacteriales bacterium]
MQEERTPAAEHSLTIRARSALTLCGILDVPSFCEQTIVAETSAGDLTIMGEELHISRLNLDEGQVSIEGTINALEYSAPRQKGRSVLGRLWK